MTNEAAGADLRSRVAEALARTGTLEESLGTWLEAARGELAEAEPPARVAHVGRILQVGDGVATVDGLPQARLHELLRFPRETYGLAFNLDPATIGCVLLGEEEHLQAGDPVYRTGRVASVPVGEELLGRVVDAVGRPLDGGPPVRSRRRGPVERRAPAILDRAPVEVQLVTGLKAVDSMFPIGRGQRELILGDRATGKTALAVDAMLNQRDNGVICIYAAIGQKVASVKRVTAPLAEHGLLEKSIVVSADAEDPPGLVYLAPYAAVAMGEYFMDRGRDVLVILDDLTRHARSYRELSLLLRRPPGREAYPGDIFFIHSRLLERSTRLAEEHGGGSLTALPVVETQAKNLSAYIPTNLISITDGQIVLDSDLFAKAIKPAVDAGESVSRVGGKTQLPALRAVAEEIRLEYAQFEELEVFTRFGATVEEETRRRIERGKRIREILKQPRLAPLTAAQQVLVFLAVDRHLIDDLPLDAVLPYTRALAEELPGEHREIMERIRSGEELGEEDWQALETACREAAERFRDGESAEAPRRRDEAAAPAPEEASRALARGGEDGEAEGGGKTADEPRD